MKTLDTWTISEIADELQVKRHRVIYYVRDEGIEPVAKVGPAKVFDAKAVALVAERLGVDAPVSVD